MDLFVIILTVILAPLAAASSGRRRWSDGEPVAKHRQRAVDRVGRVLFLRTEEVEQAVQRVV